MGPTDKSSLKTPPASAAKPTSPKSRFAKGLYRQTPPKSGNNNSPTTKNSTNILNTCKLRSGDVIAISRGKNGRHAFLQPLVSFLTKSDEGTDAMKTLNIAKVLWEVDPQSPDQYLEDTAPDKTLQPRYTAFIMIVPEEEKNKNTPEMRKRWAEGICFTNNQPKIAQNYKFGGSTLRFGSDITPPNNGSNSDLPPLSRFLTISDTMDIIREAYHDPNTGENPTVQEVLEQPEWLSSYYEEKHISTVFTLFNAPGMNASESTPIPRFHF